MKKTVLLFSALIVALLILFQISKYTYLSGEASIEWIIAIVAVVFLFIGFYLNKRAKNHIPHETDQLNFNKIKELGISNREYEVLLLLCNGLSNKEIADKLFLSESTIKSHVSSLLLKLGAKRRTQAIQKAKSYQIIG